jgi:cytochrome c-type biogenesis protein CcmH/NrfG
MPHAAATPAPPETPDAASALPPLGRPTRSAASYLEDAERARDAGDLPGALLALRYAHLIEPSNVVIAGELALMLVIVDERAYAREAGRIAREARRANPALPMPYVVLGILMEQLRDSARAEQLYRHALARDPECDEAARRLERLATRRSR